MGRKTAKGRQGFLQFTQRGGRRAGAGRPKGKDSGVPHRTRERLAKRFPVHVTLRLKQGLPNLRDFGTYTLLRKAFAAAKREWFRIVQYSIQGNHLHLVVEADDREYLSRGMQGLTIRIAKGLNKLWGRSGKVFRDRFHARILRTPKEVRNTLVYVFGNSWHHRVRVAQDLDMFTSAPWFDGWVEKFEVRNLPECPVAKPKTWLMRTGWWKHHGKISLREMAA